MAEWSIAAVSKTVMAKVIVGSNPTMLTTAGVSIVDAEINETAQAM